MSCSASPDLAPRVFCALDRLCDDAPVLGLAASGGSDLTALLLLAADWAHDRDRRIAVATVDHGLRQEAAAEAAQVATLAASLGVSHHTLVWRRDAAGAVSQASARDARHALLAGWAGDNGLHQIALGHTRDDRIETFLIRCRAGSGWYGLAGPMPAAPSPAWPVGGSVRLIRPLLSSRRDDLRAELTARAQTWIDDPSNDQPRHERIRMRRLAARLPAPAHDRIIAIMNRLARLRAAVLAEARAALAEVAFAGDAARVSAATLSRLAPESRLRLLEALVLACGGGALPPPAESLFRLAAAGGNVAGALLFPEPAGLTISPEPPRRGAAPRPPPAWSRAVALLDDPSTDVLEL